MFHYEFFFKLAHCIYYYLLKKGFLNGFFSTGVNNKDTLNILIWTYVQCIYQYSLICVIKIQKRLNIFTNKIRCY